MSGAFRIVDCGLRIEKQRRCLFLNPQSAIRNPRSHRAFTLAEVVVSLSVLTILMLAMGSAVVVAARALPAPSAPVNSELSLASALDRLCAELRYSKVIESSSGTAIQFTVADRAQDGTDEHILYQWLGAGNPLTRTYNGGTAVAISEPLSNFSLTYQNKKVTTSTTVATTVDSGELLFSSFSGWSGYSPTQSNGSLNGVSWVTSYFKPDALTIPSGASSVSITRVRLKVKRTTTPDGTAITVGIYTPAAAGGPLPSTTQVGSSASVAVSSLTTAYPSTFIDFTFSDVTFSSPPTELNFVIKGTGTSCGSVQFYYNATAPVNTPVYMYTGNSGSVWNPSTNRQQNDCVFEVYGSYKTASTTTVNVDNYYLHTFTVAADTSANAFHSETTMRSLNQPTITGP
jgi:prepilin-type N-terminal cleavage/methylation domain-containing protein